MERRYNVTTELPPGYTPDFVTFLFNAADHLKLQSDSWLQFFLIGKSNKKIKAQLSVHVADGVAISPVKAPFGSFQYSDDLSPEDLYDFIGECENRLKRTGVKAVKLVEPPLHYRDSGEMLHTLLFNRGFRASNVELSCGIRIDALNFEEKIESWEKRKLRQARSRGLRFKLLPISELEVVYDFILRCRSERGTALSMSLDALQQTINFFKDRFFLFVAMLEKECVAASIAIQVHPDILYNFYSGHLKKHDSMSPVVFLMAGMYRFCESHSIHLLDLGTSAINGQPNFSLLEFKMRLGGSPSIKFTFEKEL
ncbi:MAG TPA: hypothetical protein VG737_12245 [Cyclobacteriaceae bacterium]|nr:hypothetical protein [Cyclobacteriaceae bacterium]